MKNTAAGKTRLLVFFFGAFAYGALEIIWRGYTHIAMLLMGGIILSVIYVLEKRLCGVNSLFRCLFYTAVITVSELAAGLVFNLYMGMGIWDYSDMPLNFLGQICLPYCVLWFGVSALCALVCRGIWIMRGDSE